MQNTYRNNITTALDTRKAYYAALRKAGKITASEERALPVWFKNISIVDALKMAIRNGGRYLVVNGGRSNG